MHGFQRESFPLDPITFVAARLLLRSCGVCGGWTCLFGAWQEPVRDMKTILAPSGIGLAISYHSWILLIHVKDEAGPIHKNAGGFNLPI